MKHTAARQVIAGVLTYFTVISQVFGQAAILPNAEQQYFDNNGHPLASGSVTYYVPGTTTKKTTWQNAGQTVNNTNPVALDIGGKGIMYGQGSYRQIVQDVNGNVIWDQPTTAFGASAPSGATGTDTAPVGSVMAYSGFVVPTNWQLAFGQALSRTAFPDLMAAITIQATGISCISSSTTLTGFADTSLIRIGAPIEATCLPTSTTVATIVNATTVTVSNAAAATSNVTATIFPWGNGDQVTTFNVPDLRGRAPVGADCMGFEASGNTCAGNLTASFYGANPGAGGQKGGTQSKTLATGNLPNFVPTFTGTNPGESFGTSVNTSVISLSGGANPTTIANSLNLSPLPTPAGTISTFLGGIAVSATLGTAGSGYPISSTVTLTLSGGTCSTAPQFSMSTTSGGILTGTPTLVTAGQCSAPPSNPAATTSSGTGSGGTLNVTYSAVPFSVIPPSNTVNYIIKVTPNSTGAGGVVSFGGMFGDIVCDSTLTCAPVAGVNTVACTAASTIQIGCVQPDGTTVKVVGGLLTAVAGVASSVGIGSTTITGGTNSDILSVSGGALAQIAPSGTGSVCMTVNCVMTTPTLGDATATSLNTNTFTPGGYTLAGATRKTLTFDNTLTLAGIDSTTLTFQGTDTYVGRSTTDTLTNKTLNCANNTCTVRLGSDVTGNLPLLNLAVGSLDQVIGYFGATTANALSINNCTNALTYSTTTHTFGCNTAGGTGTVTTTGTPTTHQVSIFSGSTSITGVGPGTAGQALVSNGSSSDPSFQSGTWVLLNTLTASNSSTLSDTTHITSTYNDYKLVFENLVAATNAVGIELQVQSGGSFQTTGYLATDLDVVGATIVSESITTFIPIGRNASTANSAPGISGEIIGFGIGGASIRQWTGQFSVNSTSGASIGTTSGFWNNPTPITGFQILSTSGNLTSGSVKLYGRL